MPSLTTRRLFVAVLMLLLFALAARGIVDPDFWWHLRTGQLIVETGSVPHADPYSFTVAGKPWVAHEWLSEVLMYAVYARLGWAGLIALFAAVIMMAHCLAFRRAQANALIAGAATFLGALASAPAWGARPQMLSFLLASIFLSLLFAFRRSGNIRRLWALPLLTALWVNLHAGFAVGIALMAAFLVGAAIEWANGRGQARREILWLSAALLVCLAVVPLNPNGAAMYFYPFETLTSSAMQRFIQEWHAPDFQQLAFQPFAFLLLAVLAASVLARRRLSATELLLLAGTAYMSLRSARHIPIFVLVAIPILAEQTEATLLRTRSMSWLATPAAAPGKLKLAANWMVLASLVAFTGVHVTRQAGQQPQVEARTMPKAAVEFLRGQRLSGPLYNLYGWGGYVIWKLYPDYRVFMDGRADVYGDAFLEETALAQVEGKNWERTFDRYQIRNVLVAPDVPLAIALRRHPAWRTAFDDGQAVVLVKESR